MKYIAIFDVPDGYALGCASAKIAVKGKERYEPEDFKNCYAQVEPLSDKGVEVFERFTAVERILQDLGVGCAYDMPSFWTNGGKDYKVIETKYHKGYMQALSDVTEEVRKRFGFANRSDMVYLPAPFFGAVEAEGKEQ